jgi:superfamily II DNA or RNA helicase
MDLQKRYSIYIYELFKNLTSYTNQDLCKIFEYYVCIKLKEKYNHNFYEYYDIPVEFKEENNLSKNDTGIDCCDLDKTIVQCKLRKKELGWNEISTFVATQNIFNTEKNEVIVRWPNLILARNDDSKLTNTLEFHAKRIHLIDNLYNKDEMIEFCKSLSHPIYSEINSIVLRDYQLECIDLIKKNSQNIIINLPTGTGKNIIIVNSFEANKKYLILVPKIILMDQIEKIIKENNSKLKIQKYGDNSKKQFDDNKDITICIYNSIELIKEHYHKFHKIFIDEGHHILQPIIYKDEEDETENTDTYITKIQELSKFNNNVLLSATIDKKDGYLYYSKDIRDMIELGYLSDYTISIPIFKEDPTNYNICKYLIQNYMYVIIYCNSKLEAKKIHNLMNQIQPNVSKYIDCDTPKKEREKIILDYKNGLIPFLVNIHVLIEGFDAPITRGVAFLHLPTKKQTIIQTIGRCLRTHVLKNYASVILPFSTETDGKAIKKFLKILATNDSRIKKSYESKNMCGYINPIKIIEDEEDYKELELKYEMIYSSTGKLKNYDEIWFKKANELKIYIEKDFENKKLPPQKDKIYGLWIKKEKEKIKENTLSEDKIEFLNNIPPFKEWINKNKNVKREIIDWDSMADNLIKNVQENNEVNKKNLNTTLSKWFSNQDTLLFSNKTESNELKIKNDIKRAKLTSEPLLKTYFERKRTVSISYDFNEMYEILLKYIKETNNLPTRNIDNKNLANWFDTIRSRYRKNTIKDFELKELMKIELFVNWRNNIRKIEGNDFDKKFREFKKDYEFKDNLPLKRDEKYGSWLTHLKTLYNKNELDEYKKSKLLEIKAFKKWTEIK